MLFGSGRKTGPAFICAVKAIEVGQESFAWQRSAVVLSGMKQMNISLLSHVIQKYGHKMTLLLPQNSKQV